MSYSSMRDTSFVDPKNTAAPLRREFRAIRAGGRSAWKRLLFLLLLLAQAVGYVVLVRARYEGQGLSPNYFRLTTMSDILSILFFLLLAFSILLLLFRPERIGKGRATASVILSAVVLWLDLGVRRTPPDTFAPVAALALIAAMIGLAATLMTGSRSTRSWARSVWRIFRNAVAIAILMALVAFWYAFFYPTYSNLSEIKTFNADAGVIFGAAVWSQHGLGDRPSPTLRERINMGYELLSGHAIPRIVVTGAGAPGELTEAEIAKRTLIQRGVDPSDIIEEDHSHTSFEQVRFIQQELHKKQGWQRFVMISDQYHLARVCEMCKFVGLTAIGSPSHIHQPFREILFYRIRESMALIEYWLLGR
jgi:uncharacterized SAM-binding protein YcdF (DUF218 family)